MQDCRLFFARVAALLIVTTSCKKEGREARGEVKAEPGVAADAAHEAKPDAPSALQEIALREHALSLCDAMPHPSGPSCQKEVARRLPECNPPFLAHEIDPSGWASCLGFDKVSSPRAPTVLGRCAAPEITAKVRVSMARNTAWPGSTPKSIDGRVLHVANAPTLTSADVRTLTLEEQDGHRVVVLEFSESAAQRLEAATRANVDESAVFSLNGSALVARIASPMTSPKLTMEAEGAQLRDLCRSR